MAPWRMMKGVLANFLATYTSRYADYDGYWMFGLLVRDWEAGGGARFDLLGPGAGPWSSAPAFAAMTAAAKFQDQAAKAGMKLARVGQARLEILVRPQAVEGVVNGHRCDGRLVEFRATATSLAGRRLESTAVRFVAPHDPSAERRSARRLGEAAEDPLR